MSSERPEPENYTLDEMMQRLRGRGIESEPELVTRPDGTQVYRVRKRKRRTRQPHKEEQRRRQRMRAVQIGALVVLTMLLGTAAVGLFAYYNSRGFVEKLAGRVGAATGAQADFQQFRVTPVRAMAGGVALRWDGGGPLRELQLQGVAADLKITSFAGKAWNGEEVLARSGVLHLGQGEGAALLPEPPLAAGARAAFSFIRYRCENLAVLCGGGLRPPLQCREVEASFYVLPAGGQLRLNGGRILAGGWPELPLDRGLIEFRDGRMLISSIQVVTGEMQDQGSAELRGNIDFSSGGPAKLEMTFERFPFRLLGGDKAARVFNTRFDSAATLSFVPGRFESHELLAPFEAGAADNGVFVGGFPFLQVLRNEFQNEEFGSRSFTTEATGTLRRTADALELADLVLLEKNFLGLRGRLRIGLDERLSGAFDVGVAESLAARHPSPVFQRVFDRKEDGFCWTRVELSGTVQNPADDFTERVKRIAAAPAGAGKGPGGAGPAGDDGVLEQTFQDLIKGGVPPPPPSPQPPPAGEDE